MFQNENELKELMIDTLTDDFELTTEVAGINLVEDQRLRIDFLARPKSHIINCGFTDEWFGIEVKYISPNNINGKINKVFWQAITYSQSVFNIGQPPLLEKKRLPFVFVLINAKLISYGHQKTLSDILSFCQYSNVGQLLLYPYGYSFKFGGGGYFRKNRDGFHKGQTNVGVRRFTGNTFASKGR